jgi:hypothetical protein
MRFWSREGGVGHGPDQIGTGEGFVQDPRIMGFLFIGQALLIRTGVSGHVYHRRVRMGLADRLHHGQPVQPGHLDIGNDDIRPDVIKGGQPFFAVGCRKDLLMILRKNGFDNGQNDTVSSTTSIFIPGLLP